MREAQKEWFSGEKGRVRLITLIVSAVCVIGAVISFISAACCEWVVVTKAAVGIMGVLLLAGAAQGMLYTFVFDREAPNFFLYDSTSDKNLSVSLLTPEIVSRRMDAFFFENGQIHSKGELWYPGRVERCDFGEGEIFRVPAAYKMLLDLAEVDSEGGWNCFCSCAPSTVEWIAASLAEEEPAMMKDVRYIKAKFGNDPSKIRGCLVRNAPYLRSRLTAYVVSHIADFDGAEK